MIVGLVGPSSRECKTDNNTFVTTLSSIPRGGFDDIYQRFNSNNKKLVYLILI
jgi:hypothetical protein